LTETGKATWRKLQSSITMMNISPSLLQRYDVSGPRYTSYPTADRFVEAFTENDYIRALQDRNAGLGQRTQALSLYVHIPFCASLCYYCACNKIITKHTERSAEYLRLLEMEVLLQVRHLGSGHAVSQLHLGGGTPTFFSDDELKQLMGLLRTHFNLVPGGEYSIEIDPRTVTPNRLKVLHQLGFNRLSFGVQDFDPQVQKAVHRIQPIEQTFALTQAAREIGFESVNVDLIYGLPLQTEASFQRTIEQVERLKPDRIALYAYAHLPDRFKPQRRIHTEQLPLASAKLAMLSTAMSQLMQASYVYIGMDHFALPQDALAVAKRQGRLHRNFQGYSTQPDCDLIALGVSSIGRVGATYSQNAKTLEEYTDALVQGRLPIVKGLALNRDDLARRSIIMALMCQGRVDFESIEVSHLVSFAKAYATELEQMKALQDQGLVVVDDAGIAVTEMGWFFVRAVAMVFDRYLQLDRNRARFSKII
jgi:oxygen-independent coproporphyrinogen-3 oxidase